MTPRVLFIHGSESSPQGAKARFLAERFELLAPEMDTGDFEGCVARQAEAIRRFRPEVVVGSSFGGAVAVALLQRGLWQGPTLLLAPAVLHYGLAPELPAGAPVWIAHGTRDDVVPIGESRALARSGAPGQVRLFEVDDEHRLATLLANGRLAEWVDALAAGGGEERRGFARHLAAFVEEPTLWPVTLVLLAHVVLFGAALLVFALRDRNPFALAALAILVIGSGDGLLRAASARRPGQARAAILGLWACSAAAALLAARTHFL